jgi:uncharacterized protein YdeI (BOF family)
MTYRVYSQKRLRLPTLIGAGILLALLSLHVQAPLASAQPNSPTIGEIQADPDRYRDNIVTLSGTVALVIDLNEFVLDDGTGQIAIDAGPPWYKEVAVSAGTTVTVTGLIDTMGPPGQQRGTDVDACRIETPDETIEIRDCDFRGPPPWAGRPGRPAP